MKFIPNTLLYFLVLVLFIQCKDVAKKEAEITTAKNEIRYAKGLEIYNYKGFAVVKITNPWPDAKENFTYVLQQKNGVIPDSLKQFTTIQIPLKSIVVTSTTHIPALELLGVENTLVGFPNTDYISSVKTRKLIDAGKVREVGTNERVMIGQSYSARSKWDEIQEDKLWGNIRRKAKSHPGLQAELERVIIFYKLLEDNNEVMWHPV